MTDDSTVDDSFAAFLDFGTGVLSLVCLSASVIWGLVAQDRIFLDARQRMLAQAVHRTTAVAAVVFLFVHIGTKLALDHTSWIAAIIPFGLVGSNDEMLGRAFLIGLGTLASLMMIFVAITGILRNRFAASAPVASRWRMMHSLAYPAWCFALLHGLFAGRQAKPIFVILYVLSLVAVGGALALRASPPPFRRKVAQGIRELIGNNNGGLRAEPPGRRTAAEARQTGGAGSRPGFPEGKVPRQRTGPPPNASLYDTGQRAALTDTGAGASLYDTGQRAAFTDTGSNPLTDTGGFSAAYRAVSNTGSIPRIQDPLGQPEPQRMQGLPTDMQPTEAIPRVEDNAPRWPAPSPPLYEAPPRPSETPNTYNGPVYDTGNMPYVTPGTPSPYGNNDFYGTGESNDPLGTYNPNDTYDSGPATETLPGAYDAPSSGEPWNAPSGGF
ncbi:ferric reductase-like transmembrane domain-containing protein [Streptomyces flaveus]|uniref:Membrane protein n=1 Tax=Streptomyces flaveus TaxID=66370 RepID=A0A917V6S0_9ACTN|nr:ferric reductase-like transmembrane domain-containing protein [Streptomyces flaveus]GGK45517.1 membrane protein [Streptomyces flaveus]